ncbi:hypothetical protein OWR29_34935 [Actinoplanes sp. Pm04-4]|uniref:Uncharacterized protein n=1 Tax=Paractinoplanes pyxinae TaxID=2997416 RepID=A0ABT4BCB0_9ACTN|nr:hypothetical protein [Actinoplanes pyxinae]MCY1143220.1 hypothetical protein [Actinoplanes pyxinae]
MKEEGKVALVAGATRASGRAIAIALGALGATVYATGRSTRDGRSEMGRPETIEETAEAVDAAGGTGIAIRVDHSVPGEVAALAERVAVTPGWLRSERMLENFGVTEHNWRDATASEPHFCASESPHYVGRGVAALVADPGVGRFSGQTLSSADLAAAYGVTDTDGTRPDFPRYFAEVMAPGRAAGDENYR